MLIPEFRRTLTRSLHTCASREAVLKAIKASLPQAQQQAAPEKVRLGIDLGQDFAIINAASTAASFRIPDCDLVSFKTCGDLVEYLCAPISAPKVKGVPRFELLHGDAPPPNVRLINYRKRRWEAGAYKQFIAQSFARVGLHPSKLIARPPRLSPSEAEEVVPQS